MLGRGQNSECPGSKIIVLSVMVSRRILVLLSVSFGEKA